ncbi:hypothetical protein BGP_1764 [Beggiatoa sp. PS]|nr:hypothetical protein BGP_1764 [Beggiatoa sp. PS]
MFNIIKYMRHDIGMLIVWWLSSIRKHENIDRSAGELSTQIHAVVDTLGNLIRFLSPGQANDLFLQFEKYNSFTQSS